MSHRLDQNAMVEVSRECPILRPELFPKHVFAESTSGVGP
jgi:hypothetical protein